MRTQRMLTLAVLVAAAVGACKETVVNVLKVASVDVSGSPGTLVLGQTAQLNATPKDDRSTALTNRTITWSSSNPSVASVSGSGLVQALSTGSATINAAIEGVSGSAAISVNNPAPSITSLSPDKMTVGGSAFQLTVTGTGFVQGSVVVWNGADRPTQYVDATTLKASITAADVAAAGSFNVTVRNPAPGGGNSSARAFPVNNPPPVITSLSPNNALYGGAAFQLTVNGTGFMPGSVVRWKGQDHTTTFVSSAMLRASISAADIAAPALVEVIVANPAPGGGSDTAQFVSRIPAPGSTISTRDWTTCAVRATGEVYCWGYNNNGQVGDGTNTNRALPVRVTTTLPFVSIVAGAWHTCGLTSWGAAYCWGLGNYVGGGSGGSSTSTPVAVAGGHAFLQLSAGWSHTCGITETGALYCWGWNYYGQLGDGSTTSRQTPVPVGTGQTWRAVFGGAYHSCALTTAGALYCWGENGSGQLGDGTTADKLVPAAVSTSLVFTAAAAGASHTCALATGGVAYCWGWGGRLGNGGWANSSTPVAVSGGQVFTTISAATNHTCALTQAGTTYCWGYNDSGQLGTGNRTPSQVPIVASVPALRDIATSEVHTCGITTTGTAYCWGERAYGGLGDGEFGLRTSPVDVSGATSGYTAISAGSEYTCGLSGASPRCWGGNPLGQLGDGTTNDRTLPTQVSGGYSFSRIATGGNQTCAATSTGSAYCWGAGASGQLGNGATSNSSTPVQVTGGAFANLASGGSHACGITTAGEVQCWGYNYYGQVGDGTNNSRFQPTPIAGVSGQTFTKVSAGDYHTCAVTTGGQLYCWGDNDSGRLGDGTTTNRSNPVLVNVGAPVASVSAGVLHTCALTTAGAAFCWGFNGVGELGTGSGSGPQLTPVAVTGGLTFRSIATGFQVTCGVTTAGAAYCWGVNDWGQLGTGSTSFVSGPTLVAGGGTYADLRISHQHACGLTAGGGVRCWGRQRWGELGIGVLGTVLTPAPVGGSVIFDKPACVGDLCNVPVSLAGGRGLPAFTGVRYVGPMPTQLPAVVPAECDPATTSCVAAPVRIVH